MKGLCLTQPYASLVAIGVKRIETRSWATSYRGPVAIAATKHFPPWAGDVCRDTLFQNVLRKAGYGWDHDSVWAWNLDMLPLGAIVATAQLFTVLPTDNLRWLPQGIPLGGWPEGGMLIETKPHERAFGDFSPGRFAWVLAYVKRLAEPIPCRGALGLWSVPPDICSHIEEVIR